MRTLVTTTAASLALVALSSATAADIEVISCRSGQVDGKPGQQPTTSGVGPVDDNVVCINSGACCNPFSPVPFEESGILHEVCFGNPAELIVPSTNWIPGLTSDPDARWINWNHGTISPSTGSGRAPESVLYCCRFDVKTPGNPTGTLVFNWATDDRLGDTDGNGNPIGPNPIGVYVNGVALNTSFAGGGFNLESQATQAGIPLVTGSNQIVIYQRDVQAVVSGIIFSWTMTVDGPEKVICRSGQVNGKPGKPPTTPMVSVPDDNIRQIHSGACCSPFSSGPFNQGHFAEACAGAPAVLIQPGTAYVQNLSCDKNARWINWIHGNITASGSGRPPESVLYCCEFEIETPGDPLGTVDFCWAVDDRLGDTDGSGNPIGPNPVGVYINGVPLNANFSGGHFNIESSASQSGVQLQTGTNQLVVYQRDVQAVTSGIIFSACITVECEKTPWKDLGCALKGSNGDPLNEGKGPLQPNTPNSICLSNAAANAPAFLSISLSNTPFPIFCGTVKAFPPIQITPFFTDAAGNASLPFVWPNVPSGTTLYFQWGILDPGAPCGVALSNAVCGTSP